MPAVEGFLVADAMEGAGAASAAGAGAGAATAGGIGGLGGIDASLGGLGGLGGASGIVDQTGLDYLTSGAYNPVDVGTGASLSSVVDASTMGSSVPSGYGADLAGVYGPGGIADPTASSGLGDLLKNFDEKKLMYAGLAALLGSSMSQQKKYNPPGQQPYTGPLSRIQYNPSTYTPYSYKPYAQGGNVDLHGTVTVPDGQDGQQGGMQGGMQGGPQMWGPMGRMQYGMNPSFGGQNNPTSGQGSMAFYQPQSPNGVPQNGATPSPVAMASGGSTSTSPMQAIDNYQSQAQSGQYAEVLAKARAGDYNAMLALNRLNQTPNQNYAAGGISSLGGYSDGGHLLKGPGDGVSDSIPASINGKQPARLADGEFVIPARIVSEIGNGSTDAGARKLYDMMHRIQKARANTTGKDAVGVDTKADRYLPR